MIPGILDAAVLPGDTHRCVTAFKAFAVHAGRHGREMMKPVGVTPSITIAMESWTMEAVEKAQHVSVLPAPVSVRAPIARVVTPLKTEPVSSME